ncbi:hypothetical protein [Aeromonas hydrophila]|uniref:hypothetical protein n=1 Tax=Aeromonas hydrophila TaxID=644 RepID=UPI002B498CDB|nr:hypothetical protein [Aeromonas hydrophila]
MDIRKKTNQIIMDFISTIFVVAVSLIISLITPINFLTGVMTIFIVAMVPSFMLISIAWECNYPKCISSISQPWKGLSYLSMCILIGSFVIVGLWAFIDSELTKGQVNTVVFIVSSVPVCLFLLTTFQSWPFNKLSGNQLIIGLYLLIFTYALNYFIYSIFMNFQNLYDANGIDIAKGIYPHETVLAIMIAAVIPMMLLNQFDSWPITLFYDRVPMLARQPFNGIIKSAYITLFTFCFYYSFIILGDVNITYFVNILCVSLIFGCFIIQVMFKGLPFINIRQPWRGIVLMIISVLLSIGMSSLYIKLATLWLENTDQSVIAMWLAPSLLSVTFPLMVIFADFFQGWPIKRRPNQ